MENANEWKELTGGDIVKLEETGSELSGKFVSIEESKQYKDSYVVKVMKEDGSIIGTFVSKIVKDLIESNNVLPGETIKVRYKGKVKTQDNKREYKDYSLFRR